MPDLTADRAAYFRKVQDSLRRIERGDYARPRVREHGLGYFSIDFVPPSEDEDEAAESVETEAAALSSY